MQIRMLIFVQPLEADGWPLFLVEELLLFAVPMLFACKQTAIATHSKHPSNQAMDVIPADEDLCQ